VSHVTRGWRAALTAAAATALVAGALAFAAPAQASSARVPIAGTHPSWATASTQVSPQAVTAGTVDARVYLAGQNRAGLASYATAVSTPGNALYGRFLSPSQVMAAYGPTRAQVSAVQSWLTGSGLTVTSVKDEVGGYVEATGSVQQAAKAFGATFGMFKGPDGKDDRAPEETATAPASVAGDVLTVGGLDTANHFAKPADTLPPAGPNYWVAPPCSQYYGQKIAFNTPSAYGIKQPWTNCGYTPRQIRGAYHVAQSGMTGKGQTVAIVEAYASPTMLSDANQFAQVTGDKPFAPGQYTEHLASNFTMTAANECDAPGWYGEESLDVESVHGQAPDANVVYVGAASCTDSDLIDAHALIVADHLASIVSDSWGEPADTASEVPVYEGIFQAGAAEGIGFFFSSGDSGYESPVEDPGSDMIQVDYPTSSPWVTSVGGTSLAIGSRNNYEFETSWGTLLDPLASSGTSWEFPPPGGIPAVLRRVQRRWREL
jgi:subtilase family serine protease